MAIEIWIWKCIYYSIRLRAGKGWDRMGLAKEGSKRTSPYAGWKYLSWLWRSHHGGTVREHLRGVREFR